ncbi:MAG: hypothetical protein FWB75_07230 [Oscillospiraceae bacterium]|nr:hypothetical protein [Oscillospiraceae bacterium]
MIQIDNHEILKSSVSTLRETSVNNHDGTNIYLTESTISVVNFDSVKDQYVRNLSEPIPESPKSNDALFVDNNGEMFFIEFKAGRVEHNKIHQIRLKLFDSLLMLTDIIDKTVTYTRKHLNYILVYDENLNPISANGSAFQDSPSRALISSYFYHNRGKQEYIRFNLGRFQNLYVKQVFTLSIDDFEVRFVQEWERAADLSADRA